MRLATYTRLDPGYSLCRDIRTRIFTEEMNVPISTERDAKDYPATHYLLRAHDNTPIGVARSHIEGDFVKIQRFGLLPPYRNELTREKAFALIVQDCKNRYPFIPLQVYAQTQDEAFYAQFGFVADGDTFLYADFVMRAMNLAVTAEKTSLTNREQGVITKTVQTV